MILTIDVGNTNTVLGVFENDVLKKDWRISTVKDKTADEYGIIINNLFRYAGIDISKVSGIIISSVVPPVVTSLKKAAKTFLNITPLIIGPGVKTGINIKTDNPKEVGADRIVNAVAGHHKYSDRPLIIVDFGTATTFCAISCKGEYLGGAIAPGIGISTEALFSYAAKLPRVELLKPRNAIGKNTNMSMQSGIIYGFVGQVEKLIRKFKTENGNESLVIATGGLVSLIAPETEDIDIVEPYLTLEGLNYIGKLNDIY